MTLVETELAIARNTAPGWVWVGVWVFGACGSGGASCPAISGVVATAIVVAILTIQAVDVCTRIVFLSTIEHYARCLGGIRGGHFGRDGRTGRGAGGSRAIVVGVPATSPA